MDRIATVFDNQLRMETTGVYCRRAFGDLIDIGRLHASEHFLPEELASVSPDGFDAFISVDDGLEFPIPPRMRPLAWWAIDTHMSFDRCRQRAEEADITFVAQRNGSEQLRAAGIASAIWLPLACDPWLHARRSVSKRHDITFIGNLIGTERLRLLDLQQQRYPDMLIDQRYFEQMAEAYSASRIVFNRSVADDVNMRVFEALASGSLLLTNDLSQNGLPELFQDGVHLATYASDEELFDKVDFYLRHEEERERIAEAGRREVLAKHTYRHRMEAILEALEALPNPTTIASPGFLTKSNSYYEFDRPDVLELVPTTARNVLDIGCGTGRLGAALKNRQDCVVVGIECNTWAAEQATTLLDAVQTGNIELDEMDFSSEGFDCVICADVLEHLREPLDVMRRIRCWLKPDGCLVTSIPNVRHHTVVQSLLAGNWTYESAGLLDADHVRFFTRREMEKLMFRAGFEISDVRMVPGDGFAEWAAAGRSREISIGGLHVRAASVDDAKEFFAYQYLARSHPEVAPDHGLTSIIIATHNELPHTRACLDSIRLLTDEPYELIFIDNASADGTVDFLRSINGATLIENRTNRGFPAAVNQGINAARGANILLLNNDCIVTTGWLRRMLDVLHSHKMIGLVGPVSNNVSGLQQVNVGYGHLSELDGWAWDHSREFLNGSAERSIVDTDRLVGFCLLLKRDVVERIGLFDEQFGIGCFEDDDFCRRANEAGYRSVIAQTAFVHHVGSVTFRGSGVDFESLMRDNQRRFEEKWKGNDRSHFFADAAENSDPLPAGTPRPLFVVESGSDGLLLLPNDIKLSACLIVRDNAGTIRACLASIRPWVDEMVVVDTGSTDGTPQICEELGARVFRWAWRDDFAAARNVSFDHARGEWLFWMDSDDVIPESSGRRLRELAESVHGPETQGYIIQVHCPGQDPADVTIVDHVKLIRNRPDLRFEFRIHEQILPAIRRAGGDVVFTDIHVVHSGYDRSPEGQAKKLARDFKLLDLELRQRPDHPFVLFNLGMTHADCGQHEQAIHYLRRCLDVSSMDESHVRKAYSLLVSAQMRSHRLNEAEHSCRQGLRVFSEDKELLFRQALLAQQQGRLHEAIATYQDVLSNSEVRHFSSIDAGVGGFKARHNLALVLEELGDFEAAATEWLRITEENPDYMPAWRGLIDALASMQKTEEIARVCTRLSGDEHQRLRSLIPYAEGRLFELHGNIEEALESFATADHLVPQESSALHQTCRILFEAGRWSQARESLEELQSRQPDDASVLHNLGITHWQLRNGAASVTAFRNSLRLRPDSAATWRQLGTTLAELGQEAEAWGCWSQADSIAGNRPAADSTNDKDTTPARVFLDHPD